MFTYLRTGCGMFLNRPCLSHCLIGIKPFFLCHAQTHTSASVRFQWVIQCLSGRYRKELQFRLSGPDAAAETNPSPHNAAGLPTCERAPAQQDSRARSCNAPPPAERADRPRPTPSGAALLTSLRSTQNKQRGSVFCLNPVAIISHRVCVFVRLCVRARVSVSAFAP